MLSEQTVNGERVLNLGRGLVLVASQSTPGTWHEVDTERGRCDCAGFGWRHTCRHLQAVMPKPAPKPRRVRTEWVEEV